MTPATRRDSSDWPRRARTREFLLAGVLAVAVLAIYAQVATHGFVEYDDAGYVYENPFVRRGYSADGLRWAFTTGHMGNWNPLTWLSHMLDVQLFGLHAGAHHLVNVAFHVANTLLLFAVLRRMTAALWPSAVVAALFGVHPLHVESVAWIAERKDVLSTFCWFLTLSVYARYVETRERRWYAATAACFALGLMAKPMLVTVPFVLLLLDIWPLGRLPVPGATRAAGAAADRRERWPALIVEKLPLLGIALLASVVAYVMQVQTGAVTAIGLLSLRLRVENALVAYARYLLMAIWPTDLAVLYPYNTALPIWQPLAAGLALALVTGAILRSARRHPYALVGWLWYLGTLVPVIGLVQIGSQALADRYTYVPLIGIFIILAWGGRDLIARWALPPRPVAALVSTVIVVYAAVAWHQVRFWKDGETLLTHATHVTRANCVAHNNLGVALAAQGRVDEALAHYQEAVRIKSDYADPYSNIGLVLWRQGRRDEAAAQYRTALRYAPDATETLSNLGLVLNELGRTDEALVELNHAVRTDPNFAGARLNLGNVLRDAGRTAEALEQYREALRIQPEYAEAYNNIGAILAQQGQREEAAEQFRTALRHNPRYAEALGNLGLVLAQLGQHDDAIAALSAAVDIEPRSAAAHTNLANALRGAGRSQEAIAQYRQALLAAPDSAAAHYQLGVTLFEAGDAPAAVEYLEQAAQLDPGSAQTHNDLGVALTETARLDEAVAQFRTALQLDPDLPDARYNLGIALARQESGADHAPTTGAAASPTTP